MGVNQRQRRVARIRRGRRPTLLSEATPSTAVAPLGEVTTRPRGQIRGLAQRTTSNVPRRPRGLRNSNAGLVASVLERGRRWSAAGRAGANGVFVGARTS